MEIKFITENVENTCMKCLEVKEEIVEKAIPALEVGFFAQFATKLQLCRDCYDEKIEKYLELEIIGEEGQELYEHESDIIMLVHNFTIAGQELFYNRFADSPIYEKRMTAEEWFTWRETKIKEVQEHCKKLIEENS